MTRTCGHVICRRRQDRQDLQCARPAGHLADGVKHLHTIALGWCDPRWAHLRSAAGHAGGHTDPVVVFAYDRNLSTGELPVEKRSVQA